MATKNKSIRLRLLESASKLFIENGYANTSLKMIAEGAQTNTGSLAWEFKTKEDILTELVEIVFEKQFTITNDIAKIYTNDELLLHVFECVLQLQLAELNENIREMYNVSYSLESSSKVIFNVMTKAFQRIFKNHLPHFTKKDFYEREIAAAGIMRNFISVPCDMYFEMDRKIAVFLETTLLIFELPKYKIKEALDFMKLFDMKDIAQSMLNDLHRYFCEKLEEKYL